MMDLNRILVPIDFSPEAELAIDWAAKFGNERKKSTIYLLHVIIPLPVFEGGYSIEKVIQAEWDSARERLNQWCKKIPAPMKAVPLIGKGDPAQEIAWSCVEKNIDLVVMTTRGRRGLPRLVHPNLSEKVVRDAPCPVLVLHMNNKNNTSLLHHEGGEPVCGGPIELL